MRGLLKGFMEKKAGMDVGLFTSSASSGKVSCFLSRHSGVLYVDGLHVKVDM